MCVAGSVAALQPSLRAEPPERRKPRGTLAPREKKVLGSRYNPNVQVAKADSMALRTQLSTADDRQQQTERPSDQCAESSDSATAAAGSVAQVALPALPALPKMNMAAVGLAECGPDEQAERVRLAKFLAAAEV